MKITGQAITERMSRHTVVTKDTKVTLAPGAKLTCHGQTVGTITGIEQRDGAWHYTAEITDPEVLKKIIENR